MTVYWHMFVFNMPAVYYIGMKQVIYSVHSCMVALVYIWLCGPQACNNNNNNNIKQ